MTMSREWKMWNAAEYGFGYKARLADIPKTEATHAWRCGWEDADTEQLEAARHRKVTDQGLEDAYEGTWGILFDVGGDARVNGLGFDAGRTKPWQEGWIMADINMGLAGVE